MSTKAQTPLSIKAILPLIADPFTSPEQASFVVPVAPSVPPLSVLLSSARIKSFTIGVDVRDDPNAALT